MCLPKAHDVRAVYSVLSLIGMILYYTLAISGQRSVLRSIHICVLHIYIYIYICADPFCVKHLRRDLMRLLFRITYSLELYPFDIVILGILGTRRSCGPAEARCVHIYRCMCTYAYICVCVYIYIYI